MQVENPTPGVIMTAGPFFAAENHHPRNVIPSIVLNSTSSYAFVILIFPDGGNVIPRKIKMTCKAQQQ